LNLTVLVVDDEPLARLGVTARLRPHTDLTLLGECSNGEEALESIHRLAPDLVFLDIQMPGLSGLQALKELPLSRRPMVIFLTAYEDYAVEAFEVQALDYLLKPVDDARFDLAVERARRLWQLKQQDVPEQTQTGQCSSRTQHEPLRRFAIRRGSEITFVNVAEVEWIEGLGDYAGLHVGARTHLIRESLTALAQRLDRGCFLRVHRSTIVRIDSILRIEPLLNRDYLITLKNGNTVRSSRTYSKAVRNLMQNEM
jgi:two-component system LytT family response regulator